jgi:hypothetical protein
VCGDFFPLPRGVCATRLYAQTGWADARKVSVLSLWPLACSLEQDIERWTPPWPGFRPRPRLSCDRGPHGSVRDLDDRTGGHLRPHQSAVRFATPRFGQGSRNGRREDIWRRRGAWAYTVPALSVERALTRVDDHGIRCNAPVPQVGF